MYVYVYNTQRCFLIGGREDSHENIAQIIKLLQAKEFLKFSLDFKEFEPDFY